MVHDFAERTRLEYDFEKSVGYWVISAAQAFQKAFNAEVAPHGITFRQTQVLGWLALEGELSQTDLASRMMIDPSTLVGVLDRMERDGLICREASAADRRRNLIRVHPNAEAVWAKVAECGHRVRARALEGLVEAHVTNLITTLQQVIVNLSDSSGEVNEAAPAPLEMTEQASE
jgi:MarR family transcriptional regulator for hemolysin